MQLIAKGPAIKFKLRALGSEDRVVNRKRLKL
jgi:hypothetical protein